MNVKNYQNKFKKNLLVFEKNPETNCLIGIKQYDEDKDRTIISNVGIIVKQGQPFTFCDKDFYKVFNSKSQKKKNKIIDKIMEKPVNPWKTLGYNEIFDLETIEIRQKFEKWLLERINILKDEEIIEYIETLEKGDHETIKDIIGLEDVQESILDKRYIYAIKDDLFENLPPVDHDILSSCFDEVGNKKIKIYHNNYFKITKSKEVLIKPIHINFDSDFIIF